MDFLKHQSVTDWRSAWSPTVFGVKLWGYYACMRDLWQISPQAENKIHIPDSYKSFQLSSLSVYKVQKLIFSLNIVSNSWSLIIIGNKCLYLRQRIFIAPMLPVQYEATDRPSRKPNTGNNGEAERREREQLELHHYIPAGIFFQITSFIKLTQPKHEAVVTQTQSINCANKLTRPHTE